MKRINIFPYIFGLLAMWMAFGFVACTDEEVPYEPSVNEPASRFVQAKIGVVPSERNKAEVNSRAVDDFAVNNLYVFVFDAAGNVVTQSYFTDMNNPGETYQGNTQSPNTNYVTVTVPIGKAYIYGFANIDSEVYGNLKNDLDAINSRDELLATSVEILATARNLTRVGSTWLMAGSCTDAGQDYYTVTETTQEIKHIVLKRLDSEITFNFTNSGNCTKFTAKEWYCVNAPSSSMLVEKSADRDATSYGGWDASDDNADFYSTYGNSSVITNNTFTFYMPENRKVAKNDITDYNDRERESMDDKLNHEVGTPRTYVNAPDNATYVVVHGLFEGTTDASNQEGSTGTQEVSANVTYVIHLGYLNEVASDFFSNRNTKYTYNVTVSGVNSIVVEVETGEENVPGSTGEVVFLGSSNIYLLDSHYETVLLEFELDDLLSRYRKAQAINGKRFYSRVSTPYSDMNGVDETMDRNWVKIVRNENASKSLATYNHQGEFLTVDGLLAELETAVAAYDNDNSTIPTPFNKDKKVTYTCFVDEFYYDEADLPVNVSKLNDQNNIWKSFVNQPPRKLYLLCATQNSADEESTLVNSAYILEQRSIRTFYSTDPSTNTVIAYGVESINETGMLSWKGQNNQLSNPTNTEDGWSNFKTLVGDNRSWNIINHSANGYTDVEINKLVHENANLITPQSQTYMQGMAEGYQHAYIACMQRNRNEQGTNNVDDDDLKWYLPSIEQMQAFYIGEKVLEEARLFEYPNVTAGSGDSQNAVNARGQVYKHYATSTSRSNTDDDYKFDILWSEEATSISTMAERHSWADNSNNGKGYWKNYNYHYRCVRYLGTDKSVSSGNPYNNYVVHDASDRKITYDLLNSEVRERTVMTGIGNLGTHIYDEEGNDLSPKGFEYYRENIDATDNYLNGNSNLCTDLGAGWRIPNLRELTLMRQVEVSRLHTVCRTEFKYDFRNSWNVESSTGNIQMQGNFTKVRCVKDIQ